MTDPASSDVVWLARNDDAIVFAPAASQEGRQGWATYQSPWLHEVQSMVFVRFGVPGFSPVSSFSPLTLVIREFLAIPGGRGVAGVARLVRALPFSAMEAAATRRAQQLDPPPEDGWFPYLIVPDQDPNAPKVSTAHPNRYVPTGFEPWAQWVGPPPEPSDRHLPARLYVPVPDGHKKPDAFYEQVAERFTYLVAIGSKRPANELAEANGVPASTVHRWVKEARRRGILPPGQRAAPASHA